MLTEHQPGRTLEMMVRFTYLWCDEGEIADVG